MIILGIFKDLVEKMDNMQERMWNFSGEMALSFKVGAGESRESKSSIGRERPYSIGM